MKLLKPLKPILNPNKAPALPGLLGELVKLMVLKRNVLLIGTHGVGKTRMTFAAAEALNLRLKYMSASTLEPYADLGGIPIPDNDKKVIEFFHDLDLDNYHIFFIDEINRPSHIKVLNGLLELIQFLSIQGRPFKKLKMVWAGMNPPTDNYQVDDLDPVLIDRFHHFINVPAHYSTDFFIKKFGDMGKELVLWANKLSPDKKAIVTPRRLEYIGDAIVKTNNKYNMVKTSIMPGSIAEADIKILCTMVSKYFGSVIELNGDNDDPLTQLLRDRVKLDGS